MQNVKWTLLLAASLVACHGNKPPAPEPSRPVAPQAPPPAPAPTVAPAPQLDDVSRIRAMDIDALNQLGLLAEVRFDYDKADIREGDRQVLSRNAEVLRKYDFLRVAVEGHCDERGTVEYNLALGERRARAAQDYLVSLGVPSDHLKTVYYGKERPLCQEHAESCFALNRRGHFTITGKAEAR
jgi:peptidoglycan-associated lipoprotein